MKKIFNFNLAIHLPGKEGSLSPDKGWISPAYSESLDQSGSFSDQTFSQVKKGFATADNFSDGVRVQAVQPDYTFLSSLCGL